MQLNPPRFAGLVFSGEVLGMGELSYFIIDDVWFWCLGMMKGLVGFLWFDRLKPLLQTTRALGWVLVV
jgi:hypothetical protein